ncbi:MAG: hypothetical protein U5R31_04695 [Acidimicrobiia bacterium]|nr:hypothetical protein [Acidimicrobiia bacterium]
MSEQLGGRCRVGPKGDNQQCGRSVIIQCVHLCAMVDEDADHLRRRVPGSFMQCRAAMGVPLVGVRTLGETARTTAAGRLREALHDLGRIL